jgi:hypothetical protein
MLPLKLLIEAAVFAEALSDLTKVRASPDDGRDGSNDVAKSNGMVA